MVTRKRNWFLALGLLILLLALLSLAVAAGIGGHRFVIGGGGGPVSQDGLVLQSAFGQPVVGGGSSSGLTLCGGFHSGACSTDQNVFLPLVVRPSG
ncbi:MAG: hypothetical protein JSW55_10900 [Chloroflexota bacterium]|nr:MAG: hypothetical protein JSW55_10900 [Chloroflexota bacterium]